MTNQPGPKQPPRIHGDGCTCGDFARYGCPAAKTFKAAKPSAPKPMPVYFADTVQTSGIEHHTLPVYRCDDIDPLLESQACKIAELEAKAKLHAELAAASHRDITPSEVDALRNLYVPTKSKDKDAVCYSENDLNALVSVVLALGKVRRGQPQSETRDGRNEVAWLIEMQIDGQAMWWYGSGFIADANQAVRFSRKQDAWQVCIELGLVGTDAKEHMW